MASQTKMRAAAPRVGAPLQQARPLVDTWEERFAALTPEQQAGHRDAQQQMRVRREEMSTRRAQREQEGNDDGNHDQ